MLFKTGIHPSFEEKRNKAEFRLEMGQLKDEALLQKVWETLVFDFVTGNCPGLEGDQGISGVRFVQKSKKDQLNSFRIEMWLLGDDEHSNVNNEIKQYLETSIKLEILAQQQGKMKDADIKF